MILLYRLASDLSNGLSLDGTGASMTIKIQEKIAVNNKISIKKEFSFEKYIPNIEVPIDKDDKRKHLNSVFAWNPPAYFFINKKHM